MEGRLEMDFSFPTGHPGISVNKLVGRVAGYQSKSEVYTPVVRFEAPVSEDMYRITTLISRYQEEEIRSVSEIPVTGQEPQSGSIRCRQMISYVQEPGIPVQPIYN